MNIKEVHLWEQAIVNVLNLDKWDLTWCGGKFEHYDAVGETSKGIPCVIEMKFRQKYYETKMLEKYKFDQLMNMPADMVKLYFVNDPKANYLFWLNEIDMPEITTINCPDTTLWTKKRTDKDVYMLDESDATITNFNISY
jgi:hypothetical protein